MDSVNAQKRLRMSLQPQPNESQTSCGNLHHSAGVFLCKFTENAGDCVRIGRCAHRIQYAIKELNACVETLTRICSTTRIFTGKFNVLLIFHPSPAVAFNYVNGRSCSDMFAAHFSGQSGEKTGQSRRFFPTAVVHVLHSYCWFPSKNIFVRF
jgi:hypothetical protein